MILDLPALRTLVTAVDLDGFGKAAEALHRSPSAVSLQLHALEERLGKPLFRKIGRRQELTEMGEVLVGFARRMLELNDEAVLTVRDSGLQGKVRLGVPQDFADSWLPQTLGLFALAHPNVQMEIFVEQSSRLLELLRNGDLDFALTFGNDGGLNSQLIAMFPVHWYAHVTWQISEHEPLPLLVLDQHCLFRQRAIDSLDRARLRWRIALSGSSVSAVWAAAIAGLGLVTRTPVHVPDDMVCLDGTLGLPDLGVVALHLVRSSLRGEQASEYLAELLVNAVGSHLI
jgi:DNA-binding transcriptional LysR family regulator